MSVANFCGQIYQLSNSFFYTQVYRQYEMGARQFPHNLVPAIPENGTNETCEHGHLWDESDPVERGWLLGSATIHTDSVSMPHIYHEGTFYPVRGKYCCQTVT